MRKTKFLKLKMREASFISSRVIVHAASGVGPPHSDAPLQSGLWLLQRIRPHFEANRSRCRQSRLNKLADLGTSIVTISGGEPMMHPELDQIIQHIRTRGMIAGLISNGYYFTPERIKRLNKAGLEYLQISIDNVEPDEVSRKSLRVLDKKLRYLVRICRLSRQHQFSDWWRNQESGRCADCGSQGSRAWLLNYCRRDSRWRRHSETALSKEKDIFQQVKKLGNKDHARLNWFQDSIAEGKPYNWRCRAGARYLYICEEGLVHWCSQQRGYPGIPLDQYTMEDFDREYKTEKWCAPTCTLQCVHQVGILDNWRDPQKTPAQMAQEQKSGKSVGEMIGAD